MDASRMERYCAISSGRCLPCMFICFRPSGFNNAVNAIASNSSIQISDEEKKKILEEEGKQLQQLKVRSQGHQVLKGDSGLFGSIFEILRLKCKKKVNRSAFRKHV